MADSKEEINVITHLLSVEKKAYLLIDEAMKEAESRLSAAHQKANSEYKTGYEECVQSLEKDFQEQLQSLESQHNTILNEYKSDIKNHSQNIKAFNELLDKLLFAEK